MRTKAILFLLLFTSTLGMATMACAQSSSSDEDSKSLFSAFGRQEEEEDEENRPAINQYSKKYRKTPSSLQMRGNLLAQENFYLSFVPTNVSDDAVILRMTSPTLVQGCANLKQPTYEATEQGQILMVKVGGPAVEMEKQPRYNQFDCAQKNNIVNLDLPLSRAKIEQTPIRKIAFRSANHTDYYAVEMRDGQLRLLPETQNAFHPVKTSDGTDALTHWFLPENTVVLYVPGATRTNDFSESVKKLAYTQGLIPLSDMVPGFTDNKKNRLYFVDPSGFYAHSLDAQVKPVFFGRIMNERKDGKEPNTQTLDVYARTPYLPG